PAVDRIPPAPPPRHVPLSLIVEVPAYIGNAVGQRQGHTGVVGPLARIERVGPASAKIRDRLESSRRLELHGGAQGVPDSQAEEHAAQSVWIKHDWDCPKLPWRTLLTLDIAAVSDTIRPRSASEALRT